MPTQLERARKIGILENSAIEVINTLGADAFEAALRVKEIEYAKMDHVRILRNKLSDLLSEYRIARDIIQGEVEKYNKEFDTHLIFNYMGGVNETIQMGNKTRRKPEPKIVDGAGAHRIGRPSTPWARFAQSSGGWWSFVISRMAYNMLGEPESVVFRVDDGKFIVAPASLTDADISQFNVLASDDNKQTPYVGLTASFWEKFPIARETLHTLRRDVIIVNRVLTVAID